MHKTRHTEFSISTKSNSLGSQAGFGCLRHPVSFLKDRHLRKISHFEKKNPEEEYLGAGLKDRSVGNDPKLV